MSKIEDKMIELQNKKDKFLSEHKEKMRALQEELEKEPAPERGPTQVVSPQAIESQEKVHGG